MKRLMLVMILTISMAIPAYANSMAPTSIPGKAGIYVDKESGIELLDETIDITVDKNLDKTQYLVHYTFKNTHNTSIEKPIWFLSRGYLNSHKFTVKIGGKDVKSESVDIEFDEIKNWDADDQLAYIDPFTNEFFDSEIDKYSSNQLSISEFILKMDAGQLIDVVVEYEVWNGYISAGVTDYIHNVKLTSYMLSPAAFYEGEGKVDIKVTMPENTILRSNLNLSNTDENTYRLEDYTLNEYENLYLSFIPKPGITELFAHNAIGYKIRLLILQALILLGSIYAKQTHLKRSLKYLFIISFIAYVRTAGYGSIFLLIFIIPIIMLALLYTVNKDKKQNKGPE